MGKRKMHGSKKLKDEPVLSELLLEYLSEDAVIIEGFNDCIVGVGEQNSGQCSVLIYDAQKMIDAMVAEWNLSMEDAEEYFSHSILGCWNSDIGAPIFRYFEVENGDVVQQRTYEESKI